MALAGLGGSASAWVERALISANGSVALETHSVTVGGGGRVKADISGRVITVEGDVQGDLNAHEQIVLRGSAKVQGDLKAPRVVLEDGASFRGLVDMGPPAAKEPKEGRRPADGGARTPAAEATPSEYVSASELLEQFRRRLKPDERRIADLRAAGRSWAEIGAEVGLDAHAARKRLVRARERVGRTLGMVDDAETEQPEDGATPEEPSS